MKLTRGCTQSRNCRIRSIGYVPQAVCCCLRLENVYGVVCVSVCIGRQRELHAIFPPTKCLLWTEFALLVYTTRSCIWHVIHICMRECDVACFDAVFNLTEVRCFIRTTTKFPSMKCKSKRKRETGSLCLNICAELNVRRVRCINVCGYWHCSSCYFLPIYRIVGNCGDDGSHIHSAPFSSLCLCVCTLFPTKITPGFVHT